MGFKGKMTVMAMGREGCERDKGLWAVKAMEEKDGQSSYKQLATGDSLKQGHLE